MLNAASRPLAFPPGTHWAYSSGTTNLISRVIRDLAGGDEKSYRGFVDHIAYRGPVCIEVEDREYESTLARRQEALRWCGSYLAGLMPPAR